MQDETACLLYQDQKYKMNASDSFRTYTQPFAVSGSKGLKRDCWLKDVVECPTLASERKHICYSLYDGKVCWDTGFHDNIV